MSFAVIYRKIDLLLKHVFLCVSTLLFDLFSRSNHDLYQEKKKIIIIIIIKIKKKMDFLAPDLLKG